MHHGVAGDLVDREHQPLGTRARNAHGCRGGADQCAHPVESGEIEVDGGVRLPADWPDAGIESPAEVVRLLVTVAGGMPTRLGEHRMGARSVLEDLRWERARVVGADEVDFHALEGHVRHRLVPGPVSNPRLAPGRPGRLHEHARPAGPALLRPADELVPGAGRGLEPLLDRQQGHSVGLAAESGSQPIDVPSLHGDEDELLSGGSLLEEGNRDLREAHHRTRRSGPNEGILDWGRTLPRRAASLCLYPVTAN